MLGRVFEGVMEPGARKRSGTYYTPRALVRSVVDAALAGFVGGRLGLSPTRDALRRLSAGDERAAGLLDDITILDPAVGSGAFLLGALERLIAFRKAAGDGRDTAAIVARNLYGVDLNPAAVRLCELRLWLAIISARSGRRAGTPSHPLPNLDAFMRQGDSLADPMRLMLRHPAALAPACSGPGGRAPRRGGGEWGRQARGAPAPPAGWRWTRRPSGSRPPSASARPRSGRSSPRGTTPRCSGSDATSIRERPGPSALPGRRLKELRRLRRRASRGGRGPFVRFRHPVRRRDGRGGVRPRGRESALGARGVARRRPHGRSSRSAFAGGAPASGRGYGHQPDLAVAFLERAWELTRPGGVMAMLVPAKVATAAYGAAARTALSEGGTVLAVADLTNMPDASFDATTYPLAIVARSHRPPADHRPRLGLDPGSSVALGEMAPGGGPWILVPDTLQAALARLRRHPPLSESTRIQLGVKTGANHLFLAPAAEIEEELLRPAVHGKDLRPFLATPSGRIVWTHDARGQVRQSLPPQASCHFRRHAEALRGRSDDAGAVPWSLFRASAGRRVPRVIWADLARRLEAACLVEPPSLEWVPMNSCYVVLADSTAGALALCAWLNSTWIRAAARATADPASGGFARFNARAVGAVPLPRAALGDERLTALARRGGAGDDVQVELDELVGAWLELRPRDQRALAEVVGVGAERRRRGPAAAQGSAGRDPRSRPARTS